MKLYHASKKAGLKVLKQHAHNVVDGEKVVFATTDKVFALAMTYGSGDELASGYTTNKKTGKKEFYLSELEPDALKLLENPASLYVVDESTFSHDERLMKEELISRKEVKVVEEIRIENVREQLEDWGASIIAYDDVKKP